MSPERCSAAGLRSVFSACFGAVFFGAAFWGAVCLGTASCRAACSAGFRSVFGVAFWVDFLAACRWGAPVTSRVSRCPGMMRSGSEPTTVRLAAYSRSQPPLTRSVDAMPESESPRATV
ncbi:hypothetical protein GA0115239_10538 [Streptomyces sp. BpilaLS-43]|nr:hypothetical protein GA0115239_10538 [Streptomyces sp. BpilaLS-43]